MDSPYVRKGEGNLIEWGKTHKPKYYFYQRKNCLSTVDVVMQVKAGTG